MSEPRAVQGLIVLSAILISPTATLLARCCASAATELCGTVHVRRVSGGSHAQFSQSCQAEFTPIVNRSLDFYLAIGMPAWDRCFFFYVDKFHPSNVKLARNISGIPGSYELCCEDCATVSVLAWTQCGTELH